MAQPTEDLLAQRRLRSTELALDGARARLADAGAELDELRARVDDLEGQLLAREAAFEDERERLRNPDLERLQAALADEIGRRTLAEQALQAERSVGEDLAAQVRGDGLRVDDGVERELGVALARIGALEGELEMVRRHATEFEHQVRRSIDAAWDWLEDLGARFNDAMAEVEAIQHDAGRALELPEPWAPERLDEALSRLRARAPAAPEAPDAGAAGRPRHGADDDAGRGRRLRLRRH